MKGKTAKSDAKQAPKMGKSIIKEALDGKAVRKMKGGKVGYFDGGALPTMQGGIPAMNSMQNNAPVMGSMLGNVPVVNPMLGGRPASSPLGRGTMNFAGGNPSFDERTGQPKTFMSHGGKVKGSPVGTAKGMGAAVKGGKFREA